MRVVRSSLLCDCAGANGLRLCCAGLVSCGTEVTTWRVDRDHAEQGRSGQLNIPARGGRKRKMSEEVT